MKSTWKTDFSVISCLFQKSPRLERFIKMTFKVSFYDGLSATRFTESSSQNCSISWRYLPKDTRNKNFSKFNCSLQSKGTANQSQQAQDSESFHQYILITKHFKRTTRVELSSMLQELRSSHARVFVRILLDVSHHHTIALLVLV